VEASAPSEDIVKEHISADASAPSAPSGDIVKEQKTVQEQPPMDVEKPQPVPEQPYVPPVLEEMKEERLPTDKK